MQSTIRIEAEREDMSVSALSDRGFSESRSCPVVCDSAADNRSVGSVMHIPYCREAFDSEVLPLRGVSEAVG